MARWRSGAAAAVLGAALALPAAAGDWSEEGFGGGWGGRPARDSAAVPVALSVPCAVPAQERALREGMLQAVNARRRAAGMAPLSHDATLARAAAIVACDNARRGRMDHNALVEGDLSARLRLVRFRHRGAAEAIAYGYTVPERLAAAWQASPSHYPTLMTERLNVTGIAVVEDARGRLWWAMISARPG